MRKIALGLLLTLGLAGCQNFQAASDRFRADLATLTADVQAVNQAIAQVSASLAQNCNSIHDTAQAIDDIAKTFGANTTTQGSIDAANAVIVTWCQSPPQDIASAVRVTAAEVAAAKAAYQAAKNGG